MLISVIASQSNCMRIAREILSSHVTASARLPSIILRPSATHCMKASPCATARQSQRPLRRQSQRSLTPPSPRPTKRSRLVTNKRFSFHHRCHSLSPPLALRTRPTHTKDRSRHLCMPVARTTTISKNLRPCDRFGSAPRLLRLFSLRPSTLNPQHSTSDGLFRSGFRTIPLSLF